MTTSASGLKFKKEASIKFTDTTDDLAAALEVVTSLHHGVVEGCEACPYRNASGIARAGIVNHLERFRDPIDGKAGDQ